MGGRFQPGRPYGAGNFNPDQLITEQAKRIEALEAEVELLRAQLAEAKVAA